MTTVAWKLRLSAAACGTALAIAIVSFPSTADVTRWQGDERSAVRLLAASLPAGAQSELRAGVEIRLKAGWHTYWRYPGDSGVPPIFGFDGSRNVKRVEVRWPAPQLVVEAGGMTIGYVGGVIFPLRVIPETTGKPATLRLKLDYAICEKLCVPVEARAEVALPGELRSQDSVLNAAEGRVPTRQTLSADAALAIRAVRRESGPGRPRVVVEVAAPAGVAVNLFAEGPTPKWALPVPVPIAGAPAGLQRFAFDLDGAPPGERYEGMMLTLTAVTPAQAIEVTTRLD